MVGCLFFMIYLYDMNKRYLIVTHHSPDIDAIGAVWLLKTFEQQYSDAQVSFVDAGKRITYNKAQELGFQPQEIIHVDTGLGRFDHHQKEIAIKRNTCATKRVYEYLISKKPELKQDKALKKLVNIINDIDNFNTINWPDPASPIYYLLIDELINAGKFLPNFDDLNQLNFGFDCLNRAYINLKLYFDALLDIEKYSKNKDTDFYIGKLHILMLETQNSETISIAQKKGYDCVITKDPKRGFIRIKARPDSDINLKDLYEEIKKIDKKAFWYYHFSGKMLLNGSSKSKTLEPSSLTLSQIKDLFIKIYTKKFTQE